MKNFLESEKKYWKFLKLRKIEEHFFKCISKTPENSNYFVNVIGTNFSVPKKSQNSELSEKKFFIHK